MLPSAGSKVGTLLPRAGPVRCLMMAAALVKYDWVVVAMPLCLLKACLCKEWQYPQLPAGWTELQHDAQGQSNSMMLMCCKQQCLHSEAPMKAALQPTGRQPAAGLAFAHGLAWAINSHTCGVRRRAATSLAHLPEMRTSQQSLRKSYLGCSCHLLCFKSVGVIACLTCQLIACNMCRPSQIRRLSSKVS